MKVRKALIDKLARKGIDPAMASCYLASRYMGADLSYFRLTPDEKAVLNKVPRQLIVGIKVHPARVREWVAKWPTPADTGLSYSISGSYPECVKRFSKFFLEAGDRFGDVFSDLSEDEWWEIINDATDKYLEHQATARWEFTKKNFKFVLDSNGSVLEEWIRLGIEDDSYQGFAL